MTEIHESNDESQNVTETEGPSLTPPHNMTRVCKGDSARCQTYIACAPGKDDSPFFETTDSASSIGATDPIGTTNSSPSNPVPIPGAETSVLIAPVCWPIPEGLHTVSVGTAVKGDELEGESSGLQGRGLAPEILCLIAEHLQGMNCHKGIENMAAVNEFFHGALQIVSSRYGIWDDLDRSWSAAARWKDFCSQVGAKYIE